jgi:hypothetical protein
MSPQTQSNNVLGFLFPGTPFPANTGPQNLILRRALSDPSGICSLDVQLFGWTCVYLCVYLGVPQDVQLSGCICV